MTKKINSDRTHLNPLILIIGVSLIAVFGIFKSTLYRLPSLPQQITTPTPEPTWNRITNITAIFSSRVFLDRSSTYIGIPIKFDDTTKEAWLSLVSSPSALPSDFLMTHPQLDQLDWPYIQEGTIYLYQRQKTYSSLTDFVANPPPANQIAMDPSLKLLKPYQNVSGNYIDQTFRLDSVDYLLTTYNRPKQENGAFFYKNFINASMAIVDADQNLSWRIVVPEASSQSAYYLGEIHIDYNRDK